MVKPAQNMDGTRNSSKKNTADAIEFDIYQYHESGESQREDREEKQCEYNVVYVLNPTSPWPPAAECRDG